MAKVSRRKSKTPKIPKTIDLKADAVFEESDASKATDAALEAGLNAKVDVVADDLESSDVIDANAEIVADIKVDDAVIEASGIVAAEKEADNHTNDDTANKNETPSKPTDEPIIATVVPVKKKSRLGLYAGTFLSALVGGGIALGGAGALNKVGWLKYVPYADGLVYGGDTSKDAAALESAQTQIESLKIQISEMNSNNNSSDIIARLNALEGSASRSADVDLSSIEEAIKAALEKSELANLNSQKALSKYDELSTSILTTGLATGVNAGGGLDEEALKTLLAGQSSAMNDSFETRILALEAKPEKIPVDNSSMLLQLDEVSKSVATLSTQIDSVEKSSQESSKQTNDLLTSELGLINDKINTEILGPMADVKAAAGAALTGQKVAHSVTARSLKAALEHGGNFSNEVFAVQALLGENETLDLLKPIAEKGILTPKQLLVEFDVVEQKIFELESKPANDAGVMDKFLSSAKSLIKIRPKGALTGDSASAVASRIRAGIVSGDLEIAENEWDGLTEDAKALSANWVEKLNARIEATNLVSKLIEALSTTASTKNKG